MRQFVADASHELRTPLAAVRGYAELYRQGARPRAGRRRERDAPDRGRGRPDGRAGRGPAPAGPPRRAAPGADRPVDLTVLAADAVQDARALDPDRAITVLGLERPARRRPRCSGDEAELRQVLTNLVANAAATTPRRHARSRSRSARVDRRPGRSVEVRDHGPGVDPGQAGGSSSGSSAPTPRARAAGRRHRPRPGHRRRDRRGSRRPGRRRPDPRRRRDVRRAAAHSELPAGAQHSLTSAGVE